VVANSAIGIFQEVRAKRALDELAAGGPTATVVRDGERRLRTWTTSSPATDRVWAGDQVVADGELSPRAD
jgi:hypothetical protein